MHICLVNVCGVLSCCCCYYCKTEQKWINRLNKFSTKINFARQFSRSRKFFRKRDSSQKSSGKKNYARITNIQCRTKFSYIWNIDSHWRGFACESGRWAHLCLLLRLLWLLFMALWLFLLVVRLHLWMLWTCQSINMCNDDYCYDK